MTHTFVNTKRKEDALFELYEAAYEQGKARLAQQIAQMLEDVPESMSREDRAKANEEAQERIALAWLSQQKKG